MWFDAPEPSPRRSRGDWALLFGLVVVAILEVSSRPELTWHSAVVLVGMGSIPLTLWRRAKPLLTTFVAFGAIGAVSGVEIAMGVNPPAFNTSAFLLLFPYALFRWGPGRDIAVGLPWISLCAGVGLYSDGVDLGGFVGGFGVLFSAMTGGAAVRYRARARGQEIEQAKLRERENLARELHDTVAHHVSAIAIRAQAGLATSAADPRAATDALQLIQTEASRALQEMRALVGVLRGDESPEFEVQPRIEDLESLTGAGDGETKVVLELLGEYAELSPTLSSNVYRLAQESITNARRHARDATRIQVRVVVDVDSVRLRVRDDGAASPKRSVPSRGYGIVGMKERATRLGGSCRAGPSPQRGWIVDVELPRRGARP